MRSDYLRSSDAQIDIILRRINEGVRQLKMNNTSYEDREILKTRLQITWGEVSETQSVPAATVWRKKRAREVYTEFQKMSEHLFLPAVLAITPTECTKKSIKKVLDHLLRIGNYEPFHLNLTPADKKFFETTAVEQGFSGDRGYLNFMEALFPRS